MNADGHVYLAEAERVLDWDLAASSAELRRALELDPNSAPAHFFSSFNRLVEGEREAALDHIRHALKADPLSPLISNFAALTFAFEGLFDDAIKEAKRTLELDPNFVYHSPALADAYRHKGMFQEAIEVYRKADQATGMPQARLALAYVASGREPEAREILHALIDLSRTRYFPPEEIAAIYAAFGANDEAIRWLERACEEHSGPLHVIAFSPDFRMLYSDPRFADVLRKIGADPAKVFRARAPNQSTR
jgi:superkiller protein 3